MIDIREYAKQVDEGERLSRELHLMTIERDGLKSKLDKAREALSAHGQHHYLCKSLWASKINCDCGFEKALKEIGE